ncbi:DUF2795 domain-containing protein [Nocardia zapadnayensis]|uniref:DUF2795 domain-containing protein n=1 Tax=Nocardia rhamnosiphila TaxID=426716 RepID=UPI0022454697|nr:DUF2795 domain-containing protein [Nocardia zapadnayensis]MCX0273344.1 DUF2795 domain-containing protein [Nocardia zapadnayensis]
MVATDADRVRAALSAADFPAEKPELVHCATRAHADNDTVRALKAIPPETYGNLQEVLQSVNLEPRRSAADRAAQRRTHHHPGLAEQEIEVPPNPIVEELGYNRDS